MISNWTSHSKREHVCTSLYIKQGFVEFYKHQLDSFERDSFSEFVNELSFHCIKGMHHDPVFVVVDLIFRKANVQLLKTGSKGIKLFLDLLDRS